MCPGLPSLQNYRDYQSSPAATSPGNPQPRRREALKIWPRLPMWQRKERYHGHAPAAQQSARHEDILFWGTSMIATESIKRSVKAEWRWSSEQMTWPDETVALKVFIRPIEDEETLERFKQELRLSKTQSPQCYPSPRYRRLSRPPIFEYGVPSRERFTRLHGKPMELQQGLDLLIQVCDGLEVAHQEGVIHRDMKPPNGARDHEKYRQGDGLWYRKEHRGRGTHASGPDIRNSAIYVAGGPNDPRK